MAAERLIPGQGFINETATAQRLVPGQGFVNETVSAAPPAGIPIHCKIDGVWKQAVSVSINEAGVWRTASAESVNIGGVWKTI